MKHIILQDFNRIDLLPLTYTRPISDLRVGILKISEKWTKYLKMSVSYKTEPYLQKKFKLNDTPNQLIINAGLLPNTAIISAISQLKLNEQLFFDNKFLAANVNSIEDLNDATKDIKIVQYPNIPEIIEFPWQIFKLNQQEIENDYKLITKNRKSAPIPEGTRVINKKNIFVEENAKITFSTLNASDGYIYIGKDTEIMENSVIRGSFALLNNSTIKIGAKIYGATTIGPHSKVGGEINNVIIQGYSNKGHDGFLGNSVLGEWCNIGADSNNSNLKNNYANVRLWNYNAKRFIDTELQFCGLIMGDHSKCGINTMFNTGTVIGVSANIFGEGFPRNFIPSFSWGGKSHITEYKQEKAFEVAEKVMKRRNKTLDETERDILSHVYKETDKFRNF